MGDDGALTRSGMMEAEGSGWANWGLVMDRRVEGEREVIDVSQLLA